TVGTRPNASNRPAGSIVRRLSPEEVKRRREKGLCFKCEEKFTPGHQCKQAFVIEVANPDDEEVEVEEESHQEDEIETFSEEPEISMHAMMGIRGPKTMRLPAWVKDRRVVVLVDNGSSHNFINADLSQKLRLPTTKIEPFEVRVANGERLQCSESFRKVPIKFQGVTIKADLYALPLGLELIFEVMDCPNRYRVICAQLQLTDDARLWWNAYWSMRPGEKEGCTWERLKELIREKYYPTYYRAEMGRHFLSLKQGTRCVDEYEREFTRLAAFVPDLVRTEAQRAQRFIDGLYPAVRHNIVGYGTQNYAHA
ncbi:Unknown protein, partial [Striga hermonthica]